jgi:hypothetical protein
VPRLTHPERRGLLHEPTRGADRSRGAGARFRFRRTRAARAAVVAGLLASALPAVAADVSVTFIEPQRYTDGDYSRRSGDGAEVRREVEQHLRRLAERRLPSGDALRIEVIDIDLAGRLEPSRSSVGSDVRVVSSVSAPRIRLTYELIRGGAVLASGDARLTDPGFLMSRGPYSAADRLRYEKRMLDDWFQKRFGKLRARSQ